MLTEVVRVDEDDAGAIVCRRVMVDLTGEYAEWVVVPQYRHQVECLESVDVFVPEGHAYRLLYTLRPWYANHTVYTPAVYISQVAARAALCCLMEH